MFFFMACLSGPDLNCFSDTDRDGLFDCDELAFGSDYTQRDTDGDGSSDKEEYECNADPQDPNDFCYRCGWPHRDPQDIASTGNDLGDTIENIRLVDQCLDEVPLYDFAGPYNVLFMTAQWCADCTEEVPLLLERSRVLSEQYGLDVEYLVAVFHDNQSQVPDPEVAEQYALRTQVQDIPILADVRGQLLNAVPYEGLPLPGKCLLSPRMEILACGEGDVDESLFSGLVP